MKRLHVLPRELLMNSFPAATALQKVHLQICSGGEIVLCEGAALESARVTGALLLLLLLLMLLALGSVFLDFFAVELG